MSLAVVIPLRKTKSLPTPIQALLSAVAVRPRAAGDTPRERSAIQRGLIETREGFLHLTTAGADALRRRR